MASIHQKYRRDIDGLRAIAILSVVGFHFYPTMASGFVGVDIFFVISGFLISGIILGNLENNSFSYIDFYDRRIRRIFPALILVMLSTLLLGWWVLFPHEYVSLSKHMVAGGGFVSNFVLWSEAGYFDVEAYRKLFQHLWSLGIEEQFYICWPLLIGLIWKRKLNFLWMTMAVALVSFSANVYMVQSDPLAAFYSPLSRCFELMIGGVLAYSVLHKFKFINSYSNVQSVFGFLLLAVGFLLIDESKKFPGWWALLPCMGTFFIISAGQEAWLNRHLLGNRFLVWIGLISYPLYLWHWPVLSYAKIIENSRMLPHSYRIILIFVSIILAYLTYLLEKAPKTSIRLVSVMGILLAVGCMGQLEWIHPRNSDDKIEKIVTAVSDWEYPDGFEKNRIAGQDLYIKKGDEQTQVLFLGDSHMEQYAPRIRKIIDNKKSNKTAVFATKPGCLPIPGIFDERKDRIFECEAFKVKVNELLKDPRIKTVVVSAAWNKLKGNGHEAALSKLEDFFRKIKVDKRVFMVLDIPSGSNFGPENMFLGNRLTKIRIKTHQTWTNYDSFEKQLHQRMRVIAARTHVEIIDPVPALCQANRCQVVLRDGNPIYKDGGHLRPLWVKKYANFIDIVMN